MDPTNIVNNVYLFNYYLCAIYFVLSIALYTILYIYGVL